MEPADGMSRNSLLRSRGIETFFVTPHNTPTDGVSDGKTVSVEEDLPSNVNSSELPTTNGEDYVYEVNVSK